VACTFLLTCCARGGSLINLTPAAPECVVQVLRPNYAPGMELCICRVATVMDGPYGWRLSYIYVCTFGKQKSWPDFLLFFFRIDPNL
jgi:hypothetical protein